MSCPDPSPLTICTHCQGAASLECAVVSLAVMFLGNSKSSEITMQQFEMPPSLRQFEKLPSLRLSISDWDSESEFLRCLKLNVKLIMLFLFYKYFNFFFTIRFILIFFHYNLPGLISSPGMSQACLRDTQTLRGQGMTYMSDMTTDLHIISTRCPLNWWFSVPDILLKWFLIRFYAPMHFHLLRVNVCLLESILVCYYEKSVLY